MMSSFEKIENHIIMGYVVHNIWWVCVCAKCLHQKRFIYVSQYCSVHKATIDRIGLYICDMVVVWPKQWVKIFRDFNTQTFFIVLPSHCRCSFKSCDPRVLKWNLETSSFWNEIVRNPEVSSFVNEISRSRLGSQVIKTKSRDYKWNLEF